MQNPPTFSVDPLGGRRAPPLAMLTRVPNSLQEVNDRGGRGGGPEEGIVTGQVFLVPSSLQARV